MQYFTVVITPTAFCQKYKFPIVEINPLINSNFAR